MNIENKRTSFEKFTIALTVFTALFILTTSAFHNENLDFNPPTQTSEQSQGFSFYDLMGDLPGTLTGSAIYDSVVNENQIWDKVRSFITDHWEKIVLLIVILTIIIILIIHFSKVKRGVSTPIKEGNNFPQLPKEEIQQWGDKSELPLNHELDTVNQKISQNQVPNFQIPKKEGKRTKRVKVPKGKLKPTILEAPEGKLKLDEQLAKVEGELLDISNPFPKTVSTITKLPEHLVYDETEQLKKQENEEKLQKLEIEVKGQNENQFPLLHPPEPKGEEELLEEQEAKSEVKKISRKIEGKHRIPPNEFVWVEEEIAKLNSKLEGKPIRQ